MGIKGLWNKVVQEYGASAYNFSEDVKRGSVLHVDGNGFMFHVMDIQMETMYSQWSFKKEYGGSYRQYLKMVKSEISRLQLEFGFNLIFYFDGSTSYFKGDTMLKRKRNQVEQWEHMRNLTFGDCHVSQKDLPLPPFTSRTVISALKSMNIEIVWCTGEADQEMARNCSEENKTSGHKRKHYCYSGDSDFLAMKDCPLIKMGALDDMLTSIANVKSQQSSVVVWRRDRVAKLMDLSEEQFVLWCIVQGNDFTGHFPKSAFGSIYSKGLKSLLLGSLGNASASQKPNDNGEILSIIRTIEDPYDLSAIKGEDVKIASLYSIAFYELNDLSPYQLDKYLSDQQMSEKGLQDILERLEYGLRLTDAFNELLDHWLGVVDLTSNVHDYSVAEQTISVMKEIQDAMVAMKKENIEIPPGFDIISIEKISVLEAMLKCLKSHREEHIIADKFPRLTWEAIKFGNLFQLMARRIGSELEKRCKGNAKSAANWKPMNCFDGVLFHSFWSVKFPAPRPVNTLKSLLKVGSISTTPNNYTRVNPAAQPAQPAQLLKNLLGISKDTVFGEHKQEWEAPLICAAEAPPSYATKPLPSDAYREQILKRIEQEQVVIIHGETGCGKSSRIPIFILEEAEKRKRHCKIMVTQPRRIAVVNLRNRLREQLGTKVGMRMGFGIKEESVDTKIFFVTTGYLVQLLAHNPNAMRSITHIIIDEVHERSVDSDLLCWLTKRHIGENEGTRVLLMSATLHTALYSQYFFNPTNMKSAPDCLSVGQRRYPVDIHFLEDILDPDNDLQLPSKALYFGNQIMQHTTPKKGSIGKNTILDVPASCAKNQYDLAMSIIRSKCELGTGVLIFVSGIADIVEIQSRFENMPKYTVVAIHSEIPYEEQEQALIPAQHHEVKVIVATNAAESSVTLPNVDNVICLGTHKSIKYVSGDSSRSALVNTWISKSSAVQRAGRTGRVRPGTVYRLYSKELFDKFVEFEEAEIHRKPLHEVILDLKAIFQDTEYQEVSPILAQMLEPPDLSRIDECFEFLYKENVISAPNDYARLTSVGSFVSQLPLDLKLSKLVMYGVLLGVGEEAVTVAAALSQPKTVFRIASPMIHRDPKEYNSIVQQVFLSSYEFDGGHYSDPIIMLRLCAKWRNSSNEKQQEILSKYSVVSIRMKHFVSSAAHLAKTVNKLVAHAAKDIREKEAIDLDSRLSIDLAPNRVNRLRLALLWSFYSNLICSFPGPAAKKMTLEETESIILKKKFLPEALIEELFPSPQIEKNVKVCGKKVYKIPPPYLTGSDVLPCLERLFEDAANKTVCYVSAALEASLNADVASIPVQQGKRRGKADRSYHVLLAINVQVPELEFIREGLCRIIDPSLMRRYSDLAAQNGSVSAVVYALVAIPELLYVRLHAFLQSMSGYLLQVDGPGDASVLAVNIDLEVDRLKSLYERRVKQGNWQMDEDLLKRASTPSEVVGGSQVISFKPEEVVDDKSKPLSFEAYVAAAAAIAAEKEKGKENTLFDDIPLGMRLFNAYCMGHKDKKLKINAPNGKDESKQGAKANAIVPGSKEWVAQKEKAAAADEKAAGEEDIKVEVVEAKACVGRWTILSGDWKVPDESNKDEQRGGGALLAREAPPAYSELSSVWRNVLMSSKSIISSSCNMTFKNNRPIPVFGVAFSALEIGDMVFCEGVTLFPAGDDWVLRGLLCTGRKLSSNADVLVNNIDQVTSSKSPAVDSQVRSSSDRCRSIQQLLEVIKDKPIKVMDDLAEQIDELFACFL